MSEQQLADQGEASFFFYSKADHALELNDIEVHVGTQMEIPGLGDESVADLLGEDE